MTPRPKDSRTLRLARVCHRAALRLAPRHVRDDHGAEMIAPFDAMVDDAARQGAGAVMRALARELVDMYRARRLDRAFDTDDRRTAVRSALRTALRTDSFFRELLDLRGWRQSTRALIRRPAFAVVVLLTLACGAGSTTTLFGIVDAVLVQALPYPDAGRLVTAYEASPSARDQTSLIAPGRLEDWNRLNQTFTAMAGIYTENVTDTSGAEPERLDGRRVTPRFLDVYAAPPIAGRTFTPDEERFGGPGAAVISESFWARRFARDAGAVGRRLTIGGVGFTIVGVMPQTFTSAAVDVWLPAQVSPGLLQARGARFLGGVGRMKPGVTIDRARDDLARVQRALGDQFPATDKDWSAKLQDLKDARLAGHARPLWLVFGAVGLLWLIGIANLAGLMLVQMRRRGREMAVRAAIGASRGQVIGALMREVLVLSATGGALGAGLAAWGIALARATFTTLPRATEIGFSGRALVFSLVTSLAAALLFGLSPALHATRGPLAAKVAQGGRGTSGRRHRLQRTLVVAQVALSMLLVGSALLLTRTYVNLARNDAGFSAGDVITFHVGARWDEDRTRIGQLQEQLVADLQRAPGVEAAGLTNFLPMTGATLRYAVSVQGLAGPEQGGGMTVGTRTISAGYLRTLRVQIEKGQDCPTFRAGFDQPQFALVNRRFVETYAAGQNLVGRAMSFAQPSSPITIAGVVADVTEDAPGASPVPYVYSCAVAGAWPDPEYVVRTRDARALAANVRQLVHTLDPGRAVFGVRPLGDVVSGTLEEPRLSATMLGVFAASALALASLGLYSLFMLLVSESTREIGVRLALGASPGQVRQLVVAGAGRLCLAGVVVGLVLSAAAQRLLAAVLFGVRPLDPLTLAVTTATLGLATTLAVLIPALRAGRIDPIVAMRVE